MQSNTVFVVMAIINLYSSSFFSTEDEAFFRDDEQTQVLKRISWPHSQKWKLGVERPS